MTEKLLLELKQIISNKDVIKLKDFLEDEHPLDIANTFLELDQEEREFVYSSLSSSELADIFEYMDEEDAATFLHEVSIKQGVDILSEMEADDATDILNEMDEEADEYLKELDKESFHELSYLTKHEEGTAGAIMSTNYITLNSNIDVKDAMKILVKEANEAEVIDPLFVCDNGVLLGTIKLKDLIIARSPKSINNLMDINYPFVSSNDSSKDATDKISNYDIYALPVVDNQKLVGIITIDDAAEIIEDEATIDYGKMAAINSNIDDDDGLFRSLGKRFPWLSILLVLSLLVSNIIGLFENVIGQITALVFFQTMILDMAGNISTQSLAVTIRDISKGEFENKNSIKHHLWKEIKTTFINSILLAVLALVVSFLFLFIKYGYSLEYLKVSISVSVSIFVTLLIAGSIGSILPIILNKCKIDPALASGPFITTINDIISILIYFTLASLLLGL